MSSAGSCKGYTYISTYWKVAGTADRRSSVRLILVSGGLESLLWASQEIDKYTTLDPPIYARLVLTAHHVEILVLDLGG